jgi:hypothetical protein
MDVDYLAVSFVSDATDIHRANSKKSVTRPMRLWWRAATWGWKSAMKNYPVFRKGLSEPR